ncbi:MAG: FAD:protein FMN transferase [Thermomicrobia bacterium]|nr:FAD:protein FMN transferase [Thermomicrobia bacterium]
MNGAVAALPTYRRSAVFMDTVVSVQAATDQPEAVFDARATAAFQWFQEIERVCSRFDPASELSRLGERIGEAVSVSPLLSEAVRFALAVARLSDGAFDPTLGHTLARRSFNRHYRTGQVVDAPAAPAATPDYRDIHLDPVAGTITLRKPLLLDLGAVAKGMAIDLAAKELEGFAHAVVEAGGDLHVRGRNAANAPWRVGIRHPRQADALIAVLHVADMAVCTSGDYERRDARGDGHHLIDPQTGVAADGVASVTVVAPTAMVADALATAAFVLGPAHGLRFLDAQGVDGLIYSSALEQYATRGMARYIQ